MKTKRIRLSPILLLGLALGLAAARCGGKSATSRPIEEDPMFCVRMAQSLFNGGRVSEALASMDECLAKEPANAALHHARGQLFFRAKRFGEAETAFRKALELDPYFADAHNFLGAVFQEQGRIAEAEREYKLALENPAYPTPEKVYLNLGLLYAGQGRDAEAVDALRRSVAINPKYYQAHFELAAMLDRTGKLDEAAREYEVAEPGYRNFGDYYYRLGLTYFRLGDRAKARDSLSRVRVVSPGSESAAQADELLRVID